MKKISIIVPAYNEEKSIVSVINGLKNKLQSLNLETEIIVINDGSTDQTKNLIQSLPLVKLINHPYNKGYGAALKSGAKIAVYDWLLFYDGDGQHKIDYLEEFLKYTDQYDMIVGNRQGYQGPMLRQPVKKLLQWVANYLVEKKIPDINCGFRLVKKELYLKYLHILPNTFSASTTITMIFFKEGLNVKYLPITIEKRSGISYVKPSDATKMFLLTLRVIMLFNPLKFFIPLSFLSLLIAVLIFTFQISYLNEIVISKSVLLFSLSSIFLFSFGLLADQIAAIRREIK